MIISHTSRQGKRGRTITAAIGSLGANPLCRTTPWHSTVDNHPLRGVSPTFACTRIGTTGTILSAPTIVSAAQSTDTIRVNPVSRVGAHTVQHLQIALSRFGVRHRSSLALATSSSANTLKSTSLASLSSTSSSSQSHSQPHAPTMAAQKIDGTAIAKSIRERINVDIREKQKSNPRYNPSLVIIQGLADSHSIIFRC